MLYSTHEPLPCASQVPHAVKPPDNGTRYAVVGYSDQKVVAAARLQAAGAYQLKGGSDANKAFRQRFEGAKAAEIVRRASVASAGPSTATALAALENVGYESAYAPEYLAGKVDVPDLSRGVVRFPMRASSNGTSSRCLATRS